MGWQTFRSRVLSVMQSSPKDPSALARAIAQSYDLIVRSPDAVKIKVGNKETLVLTGDLINKHIVSKGNKDALELWISQQFVRQASSPIPLIPNLVTAIAKGFPKYWTGATLTPGLPPSILPPGIIVDMKVTTPGFVVPIPWPPAKSDEQFVEQIIKMAKQHLFTVGGTKYVNVPTGQPPTGFTLTPAPWFGYRVVDEKSAEKPTEASQSA